MKKTTVGGLFVAGKKGMRDYPQALKEEAIRLHLHEGKTHREIMAQLRITSKQTIKLWCRQHRNNGGPGLKPRSKGRPRKTTRSEKEQLEYELKCLRMENELLRNFLYEVERS